MNEGFGGSYGEKKIRGIPYGEKLKNAYLLFYEKVEKKDIMEIENT